LNGLGGITGDTAGNLYFSEPGAHLLRRISPDGIIETIAGTGILGSLGAGGPAVSAQLLYVADMAAGRDGTVYFSQPDLGQIWGITPDGRAALVAGSIVTLYGTGEGLTTPALPDGALVLSTPYSLRRPVWSP
jgi:serine/threonine-protein kinase